MAGPAPTPTVRTDSNFPATPWGRLARGAACALALKKLLLASLGLFALSLGWWGIDRVFGAKAGLSPLPTAVAPVLPRTATPEDLISALARNATLLIAPYEAVTAPFRDVFSTRSGVLDVLRGLIGGLWALAVWGVIGGAIGRIAVMELTGHEPPGLRSALVFGVRKLPSLIGAPLVPLGGVAFFGLICAGFGLLYRLGSVGATLGGALFVVPILAGFLMAILGLGLAAAWPLMTATVAAESEDAFDAISRSYAYLYQRPARYAAYVAFAWAVGTLALTIAAVFAATIVHLAQWGTAWGASATTLNPLLDGRESLAARLHGAWVHVVALCAEGVAFSLFWTESVVIYLLLRHDVDGTMWSDIRQPAHDRDEFTTEASESTPSGPSAKPAQAGPTPMPEAAVGV